MPHIQVTMLKGRTTEQKRKLAKRLTDAMVEEAGATRDAVTVAVVEVEKEDFARGGTLIADRK
jgi:4-oxalocrotonate tautomerase